MPWLFLLSALPVMIFIALTVPPGESPDESAHVIRVASLLHGQIVGRRGPLLRVGDHIEPSADVTADLGTVTVTWRGTNSQQYYGAAVQSYIRATPWSGRVFSANVTNTAAYPPFLYVPAAIALGAMRLMGQSPYAAFIAERCTDAVCYAILGLLALLFARRGRLLLFAVLLLPTALWLGGTVHPDGMMIGLTVLCASLLTGAEEFGARLWAAAAVLSLVILGRPPLVPLALLIALPLGLRRSGGPVLLAGLPGLLWAGLVMPRISVPFVRGLPIPGGPLWYGDPARLFRMTDPGIQAHILLTHPGLLLTLPLATVLNEWSLRLDEMFRVVGTLDLVLPIFIGVLGAAALLAGMLALGRDVANRRLRWVLAIAAATVILIYDAQYISWTHVGSAVVEGVQGRYFLELLPFAALAGAARPARPIWAVPAVTLAVCGLVTVPWAIVQAYYVK